MNRYYVDLDGISMITTYELLAEGNTLSIDELGDKSYYRIRELNCRSLTLRAIRVTDSVEEPTKFRYKNENDKHFYFENRLSVGQSVSANGVLYRVERKEGSKELSMSPVKVKESQVLYAVYKNRLDEGKCSRYRETDGYVAELYTTSYREVISYISSERGKGRLVSL